jgi:hypothetical protein
MMLRGLPRSNELRRWSGHSWSSSTASSSACASCAGSSCGTFSAATDSSCDPVMMHRCKWLCKWYIRWDSIWWSWLHAIQMNMFSFIRQSRCKTLLLGSQYHPRTCTISNNYPNMPSHNRKLRCFKDTPKLHNSTNHTIIRLFLFYFKLRLQQQHVFWLYRKI